MQHDDAVRRCVSTAPVRVVAYVPPSDVGVVGQPLRSEREVEVISLFRRPRTLGHQFVEILQIPEIEISATDIRNRIRSKNSIRYLVPPQVAEYIIRHKLFI